MAKVSGTFPSPVSHPLPFLDPYLSPIPLPPPTPPPPQHSPPTHPLHRSAYQSPPHRKELKRSHTLRYVLKNRASGDVLFVVLFTLYLKDDIDAEGNVKPGVLDEANKPFELRDEDAKQKHAKRGWWWSGGDGAANDEKDEEVEEETEHEAGEAKEKSQVGNGKVGETTTGDDDVD